MKAQDLPTTSLGFRCSKCGSRAPLLSMFDLRPDAPVAPAAHAQAAGRPAVRHASNDGRAALRAHEHPGTVRRVSFA
eukprot:4844854-Alexandrium_andersonii.AAC.1